MPGFIAAASLALAATTFFQGAYAIDNIVIKGSKSFYKGNGTEFFIRGVAYQQDYDKDTQSTATNGTTYVDSLANLDTCTRDIPYLKQLRTNTIRAYAVDPDANHDDCMKAFADAGIYVVADLSAPVEGQSINRDSPSWDIALYNRYASVIDALAKYDNTLGFFAGNEVSNAPNNTNTIAFVKAAVRDMKQHIKDKNYRAMGVGYAATDDSGSYLDVARYLSCGSADTSIDFFGYNIYSWCGKSSPSESSYTRHIQEFSTFPVPVFFAEYGCNTQGTRVWDETTYLYGSEMTAVFSGGIVYEYFQESRKYGLVDVSGDSVSPNQDFDNLKKVIASVDPSGVSSNDYTATNSLSTCPTPNADFSAASSPLPPSPNSQLCDCMTASLACVVKDSVSEEDYGDLFSSVCGLDNSACEGIAHNGSTGSYGAYSPCNPKAQLSYAFDKYYQNQNSRSTACDFDGNAHLVAPQSKSSTCSTVLSGVGNASPSSTSSKKSAAVRLHASVDLGLMPAIVMVAAGLLSGVGMVVL